MDFITRLYKTSWVLDVCWVWSSQQWVHMFSSLCYCFQQVPSVDLGKCTQHKLYTDLNRPRLSGQWWEVDIPTWLICGCKGLVLNVPKVKGGMTIGPIVFTLKWPRPLLYRFPRDCWRPSAPQVSTLTSGRPLITAGSQGALTGRPFNSIPTRQKWMRECSEHGKLSHAAPMMLPQENLSGQWG